MKVRVILAILLPAALAFSSSAQEPEKLPPQKSDVQIRAEALMSKARHLSDIRAKNAAAFHLKATFNFVGKDLESTQGTYIEDWVSDSQWRRETVVNDLRRIEVGTTNRIWTLDSSKDFPETATRLPALVNIFPPVSSTFEFDSIADNTDQKPPEHCATTKRGSRQEQYRFCFDQKSGALLAKLSPEIRPKNMTDYSCFYGIFRKFGDFWFPREMACFEDKHRRLEAKVEELSPAPSPDAALFKPPPGAIERGLCSGTSTPPVQTLSPEPGFPTGFESKDSFVVLSLIVDTQGRPQNLQVNQSGGKEFDDKALVTVQKWRFRPATCDGDPMPMAIEVEVDFNRLGSTVTHRH
jgi:TonB family protein